MLDMVKQLVNLILVTYQVNLINVTKNLLLGSAVIGSLSKTYLGTFFLVV